VQAICFSFYLSINRLNNAADILGGKCILLRERSLQMGGTALPMYGFDRKWWEFAVVGFCRCCSSSSVGKPIALKLGKRSPTHGNEWGVEIQPWSLWWTSSLLSRATCVREAQDVSMPFCFYLVIVFRIECLCASSWEGDGHDSKTGATMRKGQRGLPEKFVVQLSN